MGSHTSRTAESAAARAAISGPIPAGSPAVMAILGLAMAGRILNSEFRIQNYPWQLQLPQPPELQLPLPQPAPQPEGLSQPPSSPQPPWTTPFELGSSYRRQHFRRPHSPESFDGLRLRSCCFAILIETGSKVCRKVVQHSGRPQVP